MSVIYRQHLAGARHEEEGWEEERRQEDVTPFTVRRDDAGLCHIVALSGGKDSTAMALALREREPHIPHTFVCTPTGDELPPMFAHWRKLSRLLGSPIIPVIGGTLRSICAREHALPNYRMRFCTRMLKLAPFQAFLVKHLPAVAYVGLRADEPVEDRKGADYGGDVALSSPNGVQQRYPLREWDWGLGDVYGYLAYRNVTVPERTDCARCFFQALGEWYNLWKDYPDIWADAENDEEVYGHTYRSPQRDSWPASLKGLRQEFERGRVPERSLRMMEKRKGMCRTCTL